MKARNTHQAYGYVHQVLHTLLAVIVLLEFALGHIRDFLPKSVRPTLMFYHKSFGLTFLAIGTLTLLWALINLKPQYPTSMQNWQASLARITRVMLYLLIIAMPLSGWIMSTAAGYPPEWFGLVTLPFPGLEKSKSFAHFIHEIHEILGWALLSFIGLHLLGVIVHKYILKDGIHSRMTSMPHAPKAKD